MYLWDSLEDWTVPYGEMQSTFQPYFPEWQQCYAIQPHESRQGLFTFKVSLGKIWRRIAISSDCTCEDLAFAILNSVDFDNDHLDMFRFTDPLGRQQEISHPMADGQPSTPDVCIGELGLQVGQSMTYIFDFGDWWTFDLVLENVDETSSEIDFAKELERHGEAPPQYGSWDEEY